MNIKSNVLKIFEVNRGKAISGAWLAEKLGVSRNAVWKAVNELKKEGYIIDAVHRQGYCFSNVNDILSKEGIMPYLAKAEWIDNVQVFKTVDSTNDLAKKLALEGAPQGTTVLAEAQNKGKGRKGRSFFSPQESGLYLSMILRPQLRVEQSLWLTAAVAVLAAEAVEAVSQCNVQIKWVNDLIVDRRKIGGILTEAATNWENGEVQYVIVGIGINVKPPRDGFPADLLSVAGTLAAAEKEIQRNILAAKIINNIMMFAAELENDSGKLQKSIMYKYRSRSSVLNRQVRIIDHPQLDHGTVVDIDDHGLLIIEDATGKRHVVNSGEITLRPFN